jgi:hypothetical protein
MGTIERLSLSSVSNPNGRRPGIQTWQLKDADGGTLLWSVRSRSAKSGLASPEIKGTEIPERIPTTINRRAAMIAIA